MGIDRIGSLFGVEMGGGKRPAKECIAMKLALAAKREPLPPRI